MTQNMHDSNAGEKLVSRITDSEDLVDILIDVEDYFDSNFLYTFKNWIDGEIVAGPKVQKYWVTVTLKYPWHKMPDPVGGTRLIQHGTKIYFKQSHEKVPIEIKSEADYQPGTKKAKLKTVKIWLITMVIPRRFVANLTKEVMDMYDDDVDTEMVDDATAQGITTDSAVNQQPEEGGFQ